MSRYDYTTNTKQITNAMLMPEVVRLIGEGHTVTLPLKGYSMRPFLEDGRDKAVLGPASELATGDVVLAEISTERYVMHRIIDIDNSHVTLLGDGNTKPERCRLKDIKAKAKGFYRKGRTKLDSTDGRKWSMYSTVWMALRPIRRYLLFIYRHSQTNKHQ